MTGRGQSHWAPGREHAPATPGPSVRHTRPGGWETPGLPEDDGTELVATKDKKRIVPRNRTSTEFSIAKRPQIRWEQGGRRGSAMGSRGE